MRTLILYLCLLPLASCGVKHEAPPNVNSEKPVRKLLDIPRDNPAYEASEHIPPSEVLGVTCKNGEQPGYWSYFGWIPTTLIQNCK
jgi:hypothetical protein